MPCAVQAIQVDGGSEFTRVFETACAEHGIALSVLPRRSPKLNGWVERLNGTARREFWECYDGGDLDLPTLQAAQRTWETTYKTSDHTRHSGTRPQLLPSFLAILRCIEPAHPFVSTHRKR